MPLMFYKLSGEKDHGTSNQYERNVVKRTA